MRPCVRTRPIGAEPGGDLTLFGDALFCNTVMPDGSVNDRDCGRETACGHQTRPGPDCVACANLPDRIGQAKSRQGGGCVYAVAADGPSANALCATHCCECDCCAAATACDPDGLCSPAA